jgi:hypothetical protein
MEVFVAASPDRFPPTLKSRCQKIVMQPRRLLDVKVSKVATEEYCSNERSNWLGKRGRWMNTETRQFTAAERERYSCDGSRFEFLKVMH